MLIHGKGPPFRLTSATSKHPSVILMNDPFSAHSNSQLIREAQRGFVIVIALLALLGYVIFFKFIGSLSEIPEHVRDAPIAQPVWPYDQPPAEQKSDLLKQYQVDKLNADNPDTGIPDSDAIARKESISTTEPFSHDLPDFQYRHRQTSPPTELIQKDPDLPSPFDMADSQENWKAGKDPLGQTEVQTASHHGLANEVGNATAEAQAAGTDSPPAIALAAHQGGANQPVDLDDPDLFQTLTPEPSAGSSGLQSGSLTNSSSTANRDFLPPWNKTLESSEGIQQEIPRPQPETAAAAARRTDRPFSWGAALNFLQLSTRSLRPWIFPDPKATLPDRVDSSVSQTGDPVKLTVKYHRVLANESFWTISQQHYGSGEYFRWLYLFNQLRVGDYDGLRAGMEIEIPELEPLRDWALDNSNQEKAGVLTASSEISLLAEHLTVAGETLFSIAADRLGQASRYVEIWELNRHQLPPDAQYLSPLPANLRLLLPK